jgi:hypothetical protein
MASVARTLGIPALLVGILVVASCGGSDGSTTAGMTFIANADDSVSACKTGADGLFAECRLITPDANLESLSGISISGNRVFLLDMEKDVVDSCVLDSSSMPGSCVTSDAGGLLRAAVGITVSDGNVYIGNEDHTVIGCSVNDSGLLVNCSKQAGDGTFSYPSAIATWDKLAYVLNAGSSTVARCVAGQNGVLSACQTVPFGATDIDSALSSLVIANGYAYATSNLTASVYTCAITPAGEFNACQTTPLDESMSMVSSAAVNGNLLYLTGSATDTMAVCTLSNNMISFCQYANSDVFLAPVAVAIRPAG